MINEFDCVQITIINNRIVGSGVHTYTNKDFDELINVCGWTETYNGVMNDDGDIFTIIQKCEE